MLDEMTRQNTSKFAIFYIGIQKPKVAFSIFHFVLGPFFVMNALVYVDIGQGIHKGGKGQSTKRKMEKATLGFRIGI